LSGIESVNRVGDGHLHVRVRRPSDPVGQQPGEAVVEPATVVRVDVVVPPVALAVQLLLDDQPSVGRDAPGARVPDLLVEHPGHCANRVIV
jgi:hypothetical protein